MEHFERYTSLSDERTLDILSFIGDHGGSCSTTDLRTVISNYPTLRERLEWLEEDGLVKIRRAYAPVKKTSVEVTEAGRKVLSAISFRYGSISLRYADPILRCLSKGEKVHYADLLKCVSNQRTLEKVLPELEKDGLIVCGVEDFSYRAKYAVATDAGVKVGKGFAKAFRIIRRNVAV